MPKRIAIAAAMAGALFGGADDAQARSESRNRRFERAPAKILSPLADEPLRAGESYELAWEPTAALSDHPGIEEWEAFLSLDEGAHYSVRLTPHLDLDLRRVTITMPEFASDRARILLRFGNEVEEFEYELPETWRIANSTLPSAFEPGWSRTPGEIARPGDEIETGVVRWLDGSRRGTSETTRSASPGGANWDQRLQPGWFVVRVATSSPGAPQAVEPPLSSHPSSTPFAPPSPKETTAPRVATVDPRASTCRQNE